ncbi:MAG: DinB family protein [Balneolaceae bacterium]|nr:DinB family protein [Balneolaceae bacterium]
MSRSKSLVLINIRFLNQGLELLKKISDEQYVFSDPKLFDSGIGKHIRHILDHYQSLINGWNNKIDYDARVRNTDVETSTEKAIEKINLIINSLKRYSNAKYSIDQEVLIRSNDASNTSDTPWSTSSIKRELQFMVSHTVHHYALIALILRFQGIKVAPDFGVAPSTLQYESKELMQ